MTINCITKQNIPKTLIQEAILNPPVSYWGTGAIRATVEDQFIKYTYPHTQRRGRHGNPHDMDGYPLPDYLLE